MGFSDISTRVLFNALLLCCLVEIGVALEHYVRKPGGQSTLPHLGQTRRVTFANTICGPITVKSINSQWRRQICHAVAQTTNRRVVFASGRRATAVFRKTGWSEVGISS